MLHKLRLICINFILMKHIWIGCFFFLATQMTIGQNWMTNFTQAKSLAAKEHKPIVLVFQGSDWCAPCIKLDKEIWSTEEFKSYSKDHFVMLKADFPRKKKNTLSPEIQKQNGELAERYNPNGFFPYVLVLDEKGLVKGSTGYQKTTPKEFIKLLESYH